MNQRVWSCIKSQIKLAHVGGSMALPLQMNLAVGRGSMDEMAQARRDDEVPWIPFWTPHTSKRK